MFARKRTSQRYIWVALLSVLFAGLSSLAYMLPSTSQSAQAAKFEFALLGDLPYTAEQEAKFPNLVRDINAANVAFAVHDGDFKSGSTLCSDEMFRDRFNLFQTFQDPLVFVPGDNEWTDCHRANNGGFDPLERLAKLREMFFAGDRSLGQRTIQLTRQSSDPQFAKFRENVRWVYGNVMFVGLNVTGSNNNLGRIPSADAEYAERNAANLAWMREAFNLAKRNNNQGIMLVIQANPGFELPANHPERTGFNDFISELERQTLAFNNKPVVLVHGDSHSFQIDKPLFGSRSQRRLENFTRVETFGSPDVHWLRGTVDFRDPNLFSFTQEIVEPNLVNHLS